MTRDEILSEARQACTVDRDATHGPAPRNLARIAALWSLRLGVEILPHQVALLLGDMKTVRAWGNPGHMDNWIDLAGYAALGGELARDALTGPGEAARRSATAAMLAGRVRRARAGGQADGVIRAGLMAEGWAPEYVAAAMGAGS